MRPRSFACRIHLLALVLGLLGAGVAHAALDETGQSTVTFTATGTMGMRIVGTTHELDVQDDGTTLRITVPLSHLATGIDLRDQHMREHLDVAHHPSAVLSVPRASLVIPTSSETSGDASGTMELHGRTHAVTFHYRAEPRDGAIRVSASTRVDMSQFGIDVPSYLGIDVDRRVAVSASFRVHDR